MKSFVIPVLCFVFAVDSFGSNGIFPFAAQWHFQEHLDGKSYKERKWMKAIVPGSVYSDLARAGKLESEIFLLDESAIRWVEDASWVYETEAFDVPLAVYSRRNILMRFNGLDTYARVILNDKEILLANNAHRSWQVDVKSILKPKGNVLRIIFGSVMEQAHSELNSLSYALAGDSFRAVVRKPQFHFGWDWAPRLLGCGISKTIEWVTFDTAALSDCYIEQIEVNESMARLSLHFTGLAVTSGHIRTEVECLYNGKTWRSSMAVQDSVWGAKMDINISAPMLWWSNGIGAPNMTEFHCKVYFNDNIIFDDVISTGLRSLKLIQVADSIGSSFGFELNGTSVFAKGANYVPLNYFIAEMKRDDYIHFLSQCRDANINMLRVWGGGFYECDDFYQLCDEYGIMVWQDFMFACSMYPATSAFIENIKSEATEQVVRLRNHPCIALWCGNNEVSEGWERWGWQDGLTRVDRDSLQVAYDRIFLHLLPLIVSENSQSSYHHSSPLFGRGDERSRLLGDMHDWGIWHDELPLEELGRRIPRFMSEFGIQSYPSFEVLQKMSAKGFTESDSSVMRYQRHPRGFRLMRDYAERWYPGCSQLDYRKYAIITQAVQAEGIVNAIMRQRVSQPYCGGTLFWQLNDIWPSFSWSALDFAQNEKLLFKLLQEAYAPQTLAAWVENDSLKVCWLSDRVCDRDSAKLFIRLNPPGELLDHILHDARSFENQPYSCQLQMGVKHIYSQALEKLMYKNWSGELVDWTLDCALQINGSNDFICVRKFRLTPGSRNLIIPDVKEYLSNDKNSTLKIRQQIFRKL